MPRPCILTYDFRPSASTPFLYRLAMRLRKDVFIGTSAWCFCLLNLFKREVTALLTFA